MKSNLRICMAVVCLAVFLAGSRQAQSQSLSSLHGNISDPSGAAVPNASIHLIDPANHSDRPTAADQRGAYTFTEVAPGTYHLTVEAPGLEKYENDDIHIVANAPATLEIKLKVKEVRQNLTVTGQEGDQCLSAEAHILPEVGPGLRAIRLGPSGNYYTLTAPGTAASIYSPAGKRLGQIPAESARGSSPDASIVYGSDLQVDSSGRVYVSDMGANAIKIYSADGIFVKKIRVTSPISVEPLSDGDVAVASLSSPHLVDVYDTVRGEMNRSFGDVIDPSGAECDMATLRCSPRANAGSSSDARPLRNENGNGKPQLNRSWFHGDSAGNVYINLFDPSAPTIRKYDGYGYLAYESSLPLNQQASGSDYSNWNINPEVRVAGIGTIGMGTDASQMYPNSSSSSGGSSSGTDNTLSGGRPMTGGGEMHHMGGMGGGGMEGGGGGEMPGGMHGGMRGGGMQSNNVAFGLRISQRGRATGTKPAIEAIGVDPATQEVWAAIGGDLVHFDKDGKLDNYYCLSTTDQAPVKPTTILVEPNRILIGTDPFGIFQYPRPDKPLPAQ